MRRRIMSDFVLPRERLRRYLPSVSGAVSTHVLDARSLFQGVRVWLRPCNPVFRSANLIRRTVSHFLCRPHARFVHVLRPNQSMKPTAPFRNKPSVFATTPCRGL